MDCDRFSITPDSVIWQENAWHVGTCDIWRWQIALISPDVNYPRLSQRSTGDWENLSNVFHNLTVGQHWWPNLKIAHLSFHSNGWFATFADQLSPDQMQILMHFAASDADQTSCLFQKSRIVEIGFFPPLPSSDQIIFVQSRRINPWIFFHQSSKLNLILFECCATERDPPAEFSFLT